MSRDLTKDGANVFGVPITKGSRSERAAAALEDPNADKKRERAVAYVNNEKEKVNDQVSTMCIFYNATGLPLKYNAVKKHYDGKVEDWYPLNVENGQWGAFLHAGDAKAPSGSKAYVVYGAEGNNNAGDCISLIGWETPHNEPNDTHAFCVVYDAGHDINDDEISKDIQKGDKNTDCKSVKGISITASIGTGTSPLFEAYFKLKDA